MEYPDGVFYYLRPQMHDPIASPQRYTEDAPTDIQCTLHFSEWAINSWRWHYSHHQVVQTNN